VEDAEFLLRQGAQLLVIGCNTASSVATEVLRQRFDVPIFEVISPAVKEAAAFTKGKAVGIIGTRATINSNVYQEKIKATRSDVKVYSVACPLLVPLVEEGWLKSPETRKIVKKYLHPLKVRQVDMLILGCTHYPLLKEIIQTKIGKRVKVVDSSEALAFAVEDFLKHTPDVEKNLKKDGKHRFFVSDVTTHMQKLAKGILSSVKQLELVKLQ
jgi:glutamate racemase